MKNANPGLTVHADTSVAVLFLPGAVHQHESVAVAGSHFSRQVSPVNPHRTGDLPGAVTTEADSKYIVGIRGECFSEEPAVTNRVLDTSHSGIDVQRSPIS